ncbi:hypothetical protein L2E82_18779 [Cichorium intybus]|uniref:Uncharacterized protein n=1 Tax=Cichorium intybus TaxID=13427 RepID=A0ACB9FAA6_CICIN|nr:hypothetical protein L2E82_18779 [Cichorium intybus]
MDQITFSYASSSSSSNYNPPKPIKSGVTSCHNSLHTVRKAIQKPTKHFIAPLPPAPPKVYKVDPSNFKEAVHALTSAAKLQSPTSRRLKDIAPPPLVLSTIPKPSLFPKPPPAPPSEVGGTVSPLTAFTLSPGFCKFLNETLDTSRFKSKSPGMDYFGCLSPLGLSLSPAPRGYDPSGMALMSPLGFSLSPSSLSWCSSVLLSPSSLISGFNQSPVL